MQLQINVPDDSQLATDIADWTDGATYTLTVKQTSEGVFDGISGEVAEEESAAEDDTETQEEPSGPPMPMKKKMMGEKMPPALTVIMAGKK